MFEFCIVLLLQDCLNHGLNSKSVNANDALVVLLSMKVNKIFKLEILIISHIYALQLKLSSISKKL